MKRSMSRWLLVPALGLLSGAMATAGETPAKPESPSVTVPMIGPICGGADTVSGKTVAATAAASKEVTPPAPAAPTVPATQTARSGEVKPTPEQTSALNDAMGANNDGVRLAPLAAPPPGLVTKENDAPATDYRRPKYYAVTRPADKPLQVGRLFGSCSCIKVESMTPTALASGKDGQVVLRVRIVKEPPAGVELLMVTAQVTQPSEDILTILMNPLQ